AAPAMASRPRRTRPRNAPTRSRSPLPRASSRSCSASEGADTGFVGHATTTRSLSFSKPQPDPHFHLRLLLSNQSRSAFLLSRIGLYFVDAPVRRSDVLAPPARKFSSVGRCK